MKRSAHAIRARAGRGACAAPGTTSDRSSRSMKPRPRRSALRNDRARRSRAAAALNSRRRAACQIARPRCMVPALRLPDNACALPGLGRDDRECGDLAGIGWPTYRPHASAGLSEECHAMLDHALTTMPRLAGAALIRLATEIRETLRRADERRTLAALSPLERQDLGLHQVRQELNKWPWQRGPGFRQSSFGSIAGSRAQSAIATKENPRQLPAGGFPCR